MRIRHLKLRLTIVSALVATAAAAEGTAMKTGLRLDMSANRVKTPLKVDLPRIGTLRPRSSTEIKASNWTIGCETLDRDFAKFDAYKEFLAPLGCKTLRLQGGWHKCEKVRGVYDFAWLDAPVDFARAHGIGVILETSYGNKLYPGGGGQDLSCGFPTSEEGGLSEILKRRSFLLIPYLNGMT